MLKKSPSLTSRARKFVIGISAAVTASLGFALTPQVTFAAIAITPSDYYANFNGTDQVVETQNAPIPTSGDFTVQAWVYDTLPTSAGDGTILSQGTGTTGGNFYLANDFGAKTIRVSDAWSPVYIGTTTKVTWPTNQWFHIAVTNGGGTQKLFINGELVSQASGLDITPNTSNFRIGRMYAQYNEYWKGRIDEVKIWNTDRSASIVADMNGRADISSSSLTGYYDFNAGKDRVVANMKAGAAQSTNGYFGGTAPTYTDVMQLTTRSGNARAKVASFERTYLPSNGGWVVPQGVTQVQALTVAGGGGGGANYGGGGGAGGFRETTLSVTPGSLNSVQVGFGGRLAVTDSGGTKVVASNGGNSVFGTQSVLGGGYGGSSDNWSTSPAGTGGSGGGSTTTNQTWLAGGSGTTGQGNNGGASIINSNSFVVAGGGGGAGAAGGDGVSGSRGGNGGAGKVSTITGSSVTYAGGGGGGSHTNGGACSNGVGGSGGGGNPGNCGGSNSGFDGTSGLGGGGGGGSVLNGRGSNGGRGGTGIVIVSYTEVTPTAPSGKCDVFSYTRNIGGTNYTINEIQATGTCSWDVPTGITSIDAFGVGGGGGGAGNVGSGGSGGGSFNVSGVSVTPGATLTVVVGAGGAGAPDGLAAPNSTNQDGVAGGNSSLTVGSTTYTGGRGLGGQTKWTDNTCYGQTNATPVNGNVAGGAAGTGGTTGGIGGAMASNSTGGHATVGGNAYASNFSGDYRLYGSGGGGAGWGASSVAAVGGTYSGVGGNSGGAGTGASMPNSGAGGSGGADGCKGGGSGAAGIVMVRYVASNTGVSLAIDRPAVAVATSAATPVLMSPKVAIKDGSGNAVSRAGVIVTASGTGVAGVLTATTDSSGVATFTGLTTTSSTSSIAFSAPGLQGVTQSMTTPSISGNLTVSTAASSGGFFDNGVWMATTDNTATTLNTTDLQNALAAGDVVLPSKALLYFANNVTTSGTCGSLTVAATGSSTGSVSFAGSVTTSCNDADIIVRSATNITTGASVTLQTAKGAGSTLVLWSDTDRATTAGGYIAFGQNTFLNTSGGSTASAQTGGGGIWMAGGAMGSDGYPAGNAFSNTSGTPGLDFIASTNSATGFRVFTGGGDLVMRGESSTFIGVRGSDGTTIDAGVGSIAITGLATTSTSANPHPIELNVAQAYPILITSAKPSGDAITISGTSTTTAADSIPISVIGGTTSVGTTFSATGATGNIVMNGVGSSTSNQAMRLINFNAYTVGGNITMDAGIRGFTWNNFSSGQVVNIGAASGSSSTGTFTLRTDSLQTDPDAFNVRMARVVVEPSGANFSSTQSLPIPGWTFSGTTDLRVGKATATASDINVSGFTFGGNLEVFGRTLNASGSNTITNNFDLSGTTVELSGTQMVSGVGKRFTAKATGLVRVATGGTVRTYGGLLSLWADADATGGGSVVLKSAANTGAFLCSVNVGLCNGSSTTGGGDIVLGGGAAETDTSLSDYTYRPGSYAIGAFTDNESGTASGSAAADRYNGGVYLGTSAINNGSTQLYSGGGNITVRGKTNTGSLVGWAAAITTPGGLTVDAGAGKINFDAWHAGTTIGGTMEFNAWGGTTSYRSLNTSDDSIRIQSRSTTLVSNLFGGNVGTTFTNTSGGGVLFQADALNDWLAPKFNVTGKVAFEPYGSAWAATPNFDNDFQLVTSTPSVVRFGKEGATGTVNFPGGLSIGAPIEAYGTDVTINGNLTNTLSGGKLLVKTTTGISTSATTAGTIQTNNGPIIFWADSDKVAGTASNGGNINIATSSTIRSQGGAITFGGGLDDGGTDSGLTAANGHMGRIAGDGLPDGHAKGTVLGADSTGSNGINLGGAHLIFSGNGNIWMAGWGSSRVNPVVQETGIQSLYGTVDSGTGLLHAVGKANGTACGSHGIYTNAVAAGTYTPDVWTSANTSADAIRMTGDASESTGTCNRGIVSWNYSANQGTTAWQGFRVLATGTGGGITLTGYGANKAGHSSNDGLDLNFTDLLAISGPITLNASTPTPAGDSSAGLAIGKYGNGANTVRLGGFPAYTYTNQAGTATSFATSSSPIVINTDRMWTQYSIVGTIFNTTNTVSILPIEQSFDQTSTANGWDYANFSFASTVSGFQIGRSGTALTQSINPIRVQSIVTVAGPLSIYGSNISSDNALTTTGASDDITIQATGTVTHSATLSTTGATSNVSIKGTTLSTAAITATGNVTLTGSANVTSSGTVTASGTGSAVTATGAVMSFAAISGNSGISVTGSGSATVSGTLTTTAASAPISVTGTSVSAATTSASGAVTMESLTTTLATGAITAVGNVTLTGKTTVTGSAAISTTGTGSTFATTGTTMNFTSVSGNSGISITGTAGVTLTGAMTTTAATAPIAVTGTSVSVATTSSSSTVALESLTTTLATGAITSVGNVTLTGKTTVTGSAAISVTGASSTFASTGTTMSFTTISAGGGINVAGSLNATTTTLTTTGTLAPVSVSGVVVQTAGITATGNVTLTGTGTVTSTAAVSATGTGATFSATGTAMSFTAVSGNSGVSILGSTTATATGTITTTAALSPVTVRGTNVSVAAITSTGDVTLTGSGTVTASGTVAASGTGEVVTSTGTVLSFVAVTANAGITLDASSTNTVTGTLTTTGTLAPIEVDGTIVKTAGITSTGDVLLKSTGEVIANGAIAVSGAGEFVKLWADSDNSGSNGGGVWNKSTITTNGGAVILSGGTDPLTGCARGLSTTNYRGVQVDGNITSAGGDVTICGEEPSGGGNISGVNIVATISAGAGNVSITGKLNPLNTDTSYWHAGLEMGNSATSGNVVTTTGNITLLGTANGGNRVNHRGILVWPMSLNSTSGAISVTGIGAETGNTANNWDMQMGASGNVVSTSGPITFNGSTSTGLQFVNMTITSGTSVTMTAPKITYSATKVYGAVPVLIQPSGTAFETALDTDALSLSTDVTSFTIGRDKSGATAQSGGSVTLNNESLAGATATSTANVTKIAGPIKVFADNITIGTALENTAATAGLNNILLKATQNVLLNLAYTVKTAGGDVVFWSNADGVADGNVITSTGAITTAGGKFVAAGGATTDANGYPNGYARALDVSGRYGVQLSGAITTAGGEVIINGEGPGGAVNGTPGGVKFENTASISSAAGDINVYGRNASTNTSTAYNTYAVWIGENSNAVSISATTGTITLNGDASNNGSAGNRRGVFLYPANITTTTGPINITGKATNTAGSYDVWSFPTTNVSTVSSTSGPITITGTGNGATLLEKAAIGSGALTYITGSNVSFGAGSSLTGTGAVVIEPIGSDWVAQNNTANASAAVDMSGVTVTAGKPSIRIGKYNSATSHSTKVVTAPSMSVAGPIAIYGGDITLGSSTIVTSATDNLLAKATGSITQAATPTITTKAGDLTLWADSDANKAGAITLGTVTPTVATVTTTGGVITVAGGLDDGSSGVAAGRTAGDNRPDGWAYSTSATGTTSWERNGIVVFENSTITSGGADIFMAGQVFEASTAISSQGIRLRPGVQVSSGNGRVHMFGKATNVIGNFTYGFALNGGSSTRALSITSTGTQEDSIILSGSITGTALRSPGLLISSGTSYSPSSNIIANSSSGGINLTGKSGSGGGADVTDVVGDGIEIGKAGIYSKSGSITLNGETAAATSTAAYGISFAHNATYFTGAAEFGAASSAYTLNSIDMTSSSANVAMNADSYWVTTNPTIKTAGKLSMSTPDGYASNSFDRAVTMSKFTINSAVTGVTVGAAGTSGSDQNTANVTVDSTYTIAGPISVYGGDITISGSQTSTLLNAKLTYKATGKIVTSTGTSAAAPLILRTNKGDLTLWANAAGNAANGNVFIDKFNYLDTTNAVGTSMTTGGGRISIAGGLTADADGVPTGYATSNVAADGAGGVALGTATTGGGTGWLKMHSGGGDITVRGSSSQAKGILAPSGYDINSGEGAIVLDGKSTGTVAAYNGEGIELVYGGTVNAASSLVSGKKTGTAISLTGTSTAPSSFGVIANNWSTGLISTIAATGGGNLTITASGPTDGQFKYNNILAAGGDITFNMSTNGAVFANNKIGFAAGTAVTANTGNIIYKGDKYTAASTNAFSNTGYAWIQPATSGKTIDLGGADSASNLGVSNAELGEFSGQSAVRVGNSLSGNVTVTANISMTGKTLAIRSGGNVSANAGITITAANLAVEAAGTINLPGNNNVPNNVAIAAGGASAGFSSSVNFTPAAVDSIDPIFGIVKNLSVTGIPSGVAAQTEYIGVNITGPPTVSLKDQYNNSLNAFNLGKTNYTITASVSGGPTLSGTTSKSLVLGSVAFDDLKFGTSAGTAQLTFTVTTTGSFPIEGTDSVTSGDYTVQFGDPSELEVTTAAGGTKKAGTAFTTQPVITIKDAGGNVVSTGNGLTARVTATVAGADGVIIGSGYADAVNGVATFSGFGLGGKVSTDYTISYAISIVGAGGDTIDLSVAQAAVQLTHGAPASLSVAGSSSAKSAAALGTAPVVTVLDAYGNTTTSYSGRIVASGTGLTGTKTKSLVSGVADFASLGLTLTGTIGDYTIDFKLQDATPADVAGISASKVVALSFGAATQLSVTTPAAGAKSRQVFTTQPVITLLDSADNEVSDSTLSVEAVVSGATLGGTTTVAAVDGVATFTNLKLTGISGSYTIEYRLAATTSVKTTQTIQLAFGTATRLAVSTSAAGFTNRVAFTTQPIVSVLDADGNLVSDSTVSVAVSSSAGNGAVLGGTKTLSAVNGLVSFDGLKFTGAVGSYTLTFASTGLASDIQTITLLPGAATKLGVNTAAAGAVNAVAFTTQPKVEVQDADGNVVTGSSASIGIAVVQSTATLTGTSTATASSGIATFAGQKLTGTVGSYTLRFTSTGLTSVDSSITLTFGSPDRLSIETGAAGISNRVAFATQPIISVIDVSGNRLTDSANDVTVSASTGNGAVLSGTKTITPSSGLVTFTGLKFTGLVGDYTLTYSATGLTSATETVTLKFGAATQVAIATQPVGGNAAGDSLTTQPVLKIQDADGNNVTNSTATVTVAVEADATGNVSEGTTSVAASGGTATFAGVKFVGTPGKNYKLAFSSTGLTGVTSGNFSVTHAAPTQLTVTSIGSARAGIAFASQPTLTLKDRYGYTVTSGSAATANVTASTVTGTLNGIKVKQLVAGVATFSGLSISGTSGAYSVAFGTDAPTFSTSTSVNLTFGLADRLTITKQPVGGNKVGDALTTQPWVEVRDADGNLVTDSTATITLGVSNDTAGWVTEGTSSMAAVAGVAKFTGVIVSGDSSKTYKLSFTSGALTSALSSGFTLTHADASKLVLDTPAAGFEAGAGFTTAPALTLRDRYDNVVTTGANATRSIIVAANKGTLSGTKTKNLVAGATTFSELSLAGAVASDYSLTYTAGTFTANQSGLTLGFGAADRLSVKTQPVGGNMTGDLLAGQPVISVLDASNNVVGNSAAEVTVSVHNDATGSIVAGATVPAVDGVASFDGVKLVGKPGTSYTLRFTSSGLTSVNSNAITVIHADANALVYVTQPVGGNKTAEKLTTQPVLELQDRFGNRVTRDSVSTVTASISAGTAGDISTGQQTVTFSTGRATFSNLILIGKALQNYKFGFAVDGANIAAADSNNVSVVHNVATRLVLSEAAGARAGIAFTTQPVVTVTDAYGNTVTTGSGSAALITAGVNKGSLVGTAAVRATAGVATFTNLGIAGLVGSYNLSFAIDAPTLTAATQSLDVTFGTATALSITTAPAGGNRTADDLTTQPIVRVVDAYGNIVTNSSATVTAALVSDTTSAVLTNSSATASSGVATFTNLNLTGMPGTNYTFRFSSGALTTATAAPLTVIPAAASELIVHAQPVGGNATRANLTTQPSVVIKDRFGNVVTTDSTSVITANVSTGAGGSLEGNLTATSAAGYATFAGLKLSGTPGVDYTLNFTATIGGVALTSANSNAISVVNAGASKVVISRAAAGAKAGIAFTTQPRVTIQDPDSNTVAVGAGSTQAVTASVASGGTLIGTATVNAVAGVATFTNLAIGGIVGDYTVTYSIAAPVASTTQSVTLGYGNANRVVLTQQPVGAITGDALATQPELEVRDVYGNVVANHSGVISVTIDSGIGGTLSGSTTATISNGVAAFSGLKFQGTPGVSYKLKFSSGALTMATSSNITVVHGPAASIDIVTQPQAEITGDALTSQPVVRLLDRLGYVVTSDSSTEASIGIASGADGAFSGSTSAVFDQGVATFAGVVFTGTPAVDYSAVFSATPDSAQLNSADSNTFSVTHASASQLVIRTQPVGGATGANLSTQPVVELQDRFGNLIDDDSSTSVTVAVTSGAGGGLTGTRTVTAVNGVVSYSALKLVGLPANTYKLGFTSGSLTAATSENVRVTAGAPTRLSMQTEPVGAATGDELGVQPEVKLLDSYGNIITTDSTTVVTAWVGNGIGGSLGGPITATMKDGVATFSGLKFVGVPGTSYTLDFKSGALTIARSASFTVTANIAETITFKTQPAGGATGSDLATQPVLELRDRFGNISTGDSTTELTASVVSGVGATLANLTATAKDGIVTFADLNLIGTPGAAYRLGFSSVSGMSVTSANVFVTHAAASQLTIRTQPVGGLSGSVMSTVAAIELRDRFGNLATSNSTTVISASVTSGEGGSVTAGSTATAVNGVATFTNLVVSGKPGTAYNLTFGAPGLTAATSADVKLSKIASINFSYSAKVFVRDLVVAPTFSTDSPGEVTFSTNTASTICVVDSGTGAVTIKGVGSCLVTATIKSTTYYLAPESAPAAALAITKNNQEPVVITSPSSANYGTALVATATGGSGNGALMFSVNGDCRLVGTTVIPGDVGSDCQLTATRLGDANYQPESSETMTITVKKVAQAPFALANTANTTVGTLSLFTMGGSGTGAVTYAVVDAGSANCSVAATYVVARSGGTCKVQATKAASTNYTEIVSAEQTLTFTKVDQNIVFTSVVPAYPLVKGSYTVSAVASSRLAITYSVVASGSASCSISGTKVTFTATGDCVVRASSAGNATFNATSSTQVVNVGMLNQQIAFNTIDDRAFGTPSFMAEANSNSGLTVTFSLADGADAAVCSVNSDGLVNLLAAGTCSITAEQAGNKNYSTASPVTQSFNVTPDTAGAPYIYAVSAGAGQVTAGFAAPSYLGGAPALAYEATATDNLGNSFVNSACSPDLVPLVCSITGLAPGASYSVKVAAITAAGIGRASTATVAMTPNDNPLSVTNLSASKVDNAVTVTWTPPLAFDGEFESYDIYMTPRGTAFASTPNAKVTDPNGSVTVINNLAPAGLRPAAVVTGYDVKVITITTKARGESNSTQGVWLGLSAPAAPTAALASQFGNRLVISWAAPLTDGGSPITSYRVSVNGKQVCETSKIETCQFLNVGFSTRYNVSVIATNAQGASIAAAAVVTSAAKPEPEPEEKPEVKPTPTEEPTPTPTEEPTEEPTPEPKPTDETPVDPEIDDNAAPVPFDPTGTPEARAAVASAVGNVAAMAAAIAAAAAAAAAAGAAAGARGGGSSGGSGSSASSEGGSGDPGSIANIDAEHEEFTLSKAGPGDTWEVWKSSYFTLIDKVSVALTFMFARFSPILSKTTVDGAYLRAAVGSFSLLPTLAAIVLAVISINPDSEHVLPPVWPIFLAITLIGVFDAAAGLIGTTVYVLGSLLVHLDNLQISDVRLLLGVVLAGFGPVLLTNAFRKLRKDKDSEKHYIWERFVDLAVLPFFGGWTTAAMIGTLPALAGLTLSVSNHVTEFAVAVAVATVARVLLEEAVARVFPARLDMLHPTEVPSTYTGHRYVALLLRIAIFIFVTAALMGNGWQVWVGSLLFALPTALGWISDRWPNFPWIWRILPQGIPGLALVLIVAQLSSMVINSWFGDSAELALWTFVLLPIPMLALSVLGMLGREGEEGEIRFIKREKFVWAYRVGGVVMLIVTLNLAGVI